MTALDRGHEEPTILLPNNFPLGCPALITRSTQRMLIENGLAEALQFFQAEALSCWVGLRVDVDWPSTLLASSLYRLLAEQVGGSYRQAEAKPLLDKLLDRTGRVVVEAEPVGVRVAKRSRKPLRVASGLGDAPPPALVWG